MSYQKLIGEILAHSGRGSEADPRHVEAWLSVEHPTLDALSHEQFVAEVKVAMACIAAAPKSDSEALAASLGL